MRHPQDLYSRDFDAERRDAWRALGAMLAVPFFVGVLNVGATIHAYEPPVLDEVEVLQWDLAA